MATKRQLQNAAETFAADLDFGDFSVTAWAPGGYVWAESESHCISVQFDNGTQSWKPSAFADLISRMMPGVMPCEANYCDHCELDPLMNQ